MKDIILGIRDQIQWAEKITGIPKEKGIKLAHLYAESKPAANVFRDDTASCERRRTVRDDYGAFLPVRECWCFRGGAVRNNTGKAYFPNGECIFPWTKSRIRMEPVKDGDF